ncbi:MAG: N-acylneuraminate-9-phosphate synthase [Elusimicrobia bacterium CG_4_9_14_3_um_filter_62_55]|nr:MAG: N-acylneuraminate-9-phosphate synthase [Elusimicrobia bacterium CG22_combo_CG10-13_8_21_14_all_63_91]PJB24372.1 MAG: N-acylneuraminate-9-phosphate synthase [Elusimicrobia bacterium CG_4_9_14_3_um_filter_62_55]
MSSIVEIDGVHIGAGQPCFFLAEIAGNFANEEEAVRIVDSAVRAGADAIKFQTLDPETVTTKSNRFDMGSVGTRLQYEVFVESYTPPALQLFLIEYCRKKGVVAFSAPSHLRDLELMERFDQPAYKIGSDLATHLPLLKEVAKTKKPIFLSTGMCTMQEVRESVEAVMDTGNENLLLFHCVSNYPGLIEEQNLRAMAAMKAEFGLPTGFSDHMVGIDASRAAVVLGADMIERHYWCAGNAAGPDREISSDEREFGELVGFAGRIQAALGSSEKAPTANELRNLRTNRVSIVAMEKIASGSPVTETAIDIRRPGYGLAPKHWERIIGSTVVRDVEAETPLTAADFGWKE